MSVKISALDYRNTQANLDSQTIAINNFLSDKTVTKVVVADEFIMAHFTAAPLIGSPVKVKVFGLVDAIIANGISSTETTINNFITNNVTTMFQDPISLHGGVIVFIYK